MLKTELLNKIASLLGGRAAEEIVFEDISTGAHNDLAKATDIARSMVKEYGMSSKVGQVYFARENKARFMATGLEGAMEYSEATAEMIDNEVREIISEQYAKALDIIREKKAVLDKGAQLLLDKEKIEGGELKALMGEIPKGN
jgi:cell division protease FtsH